MRVVLKKFPYRYMEYEKQLLVREIAAVLPRARIASEISTKEIEIEIPDNDETYEQIKKLTYIKEYKRVTDVTWASTIQAILEQDDVLTSNKQNTRYSTHGIHEYKGKFNPQIVHYLLNVLHVDAHDLVLDPFGGSGTTILECAHLGIGAIGTDLNPMACFIANAKVNALSINVQYAFDFVEKLCRRIRHADMSIKYDDDARMVYLRRWIPEDILAILETIRKLVTNESEGISSLVLLVASDLIRDYSFQEPSDLRIRKRISPFPNEAFIDVFERNINKYLQKIDKIQSNFDKIKCSNREINTDIKIAKEVGDLKFSAAITSPPYVTALPYIDTQRISLVWLGLCESSDIMQLESSLIGSRELRNTEKTRWKETTYKNLYNIPERTYSVVNDMKNALSDEDGFRRQAVPILLYRYLSEMRDMFSNVAKLLKPSAPYALIVGHNRTSLGGKEFFIDTPNLLAELALSVGWSVDEIIPLDTYKRYGINSKNAINKESLILLRNIK